MPSKEPRVIGNRSKDAGIYELGRPPARALAPHNLVSWRIIESILTARGKAEYYDLAVAVRGHESGDMAAPGPHRFVSYCIKSGWLHRIG